MQRSLLTSAIVATVVLICRLSSAQDASTHGLDSSERAAVFAIQVEGKASSLEGKNSLCIGVGKQLQISEKAIVSRLKRDGLRVHANEWCNKGPRGLRVGIVAPINEISPGTYEVSLQVDDLTMRSGEHFARMLRRGTYVIHCANGSEPELVSYRRTCCTRPS